MLLLATLARAALPWDCPTVTTPADANDLRDDDGGLGEVYRRLYDAANAYTAECVWAETVTDDGVAVRTERTCTTTDATIEILYAVTFEFDGTYSTAGDTWRMDVSVPAGETWTRITLQTSDASSSESSWSGGGDDDYQASWEGSFEELPDDGWFSSAVGWWSTMYGNARGRLMQTPACTWDWDRYDDGDGWDTESLVVNGTRITAELDPGARCPGEWFWYASIDGVGYGAILEETWEDEPGDLDRDGVPGSCDCDDADPARSPLLREVANDGIDQDCDGADLVDWDIDGDGHDAVAFGGDDCDDADRDAWPGADDPAGDGVDQDCDGADDIDADGDGYTVDGDDRAPDCDDTSSDVRPGADDPAGDGVDQDCDGADDVDADGDGYTVDGDDRAPDCDDTDANTHQNARDTCGDGVDSNCDGREDWDCDNDGYDAVEGGGDDCDDDARGVHPRATETLCDGIDQDCDGADSCDTGDTDDTASPRPEPPAEPPAEEDRRGCDAAGTFGRGSALAWLPLLTLLLRRRASQPRP